MSAEPLVVGCLAKVRLTIMREDRRCNFRVGETVKVDAVYDCTSGSKIVAISSPFDERWMNNVVVLKDNPALVRTDER
jgi:hypothetical protein